MVSLSWVGLLRAEPCAYLTASPSVRLRWSCDLDRSRAERLLSYYGDGRANVSVSPSGGLWGDRRAIVDVAAIGVIFGMCG
jgi:hypothetical protein